MGRTVGRASTTITGSRIIAELGEALAPREQLDALTHPEADRVAS
jgi:hypothetical protein